MSAFTKVNALRPGRSLFNLSYQKQFDCDFGELIPVMLEEMVPGDTFKLGNEIVVRFHPLNAPVLAEVNAYVHYFFVPTRLIFDDWEKFITGGEDGQDATLLPRTYRDMVLPDGSQSTASDFCGKYSLYDYFGFPIIGDSVSGYSYPGEGATSPSSPGYFFRPLSFPWYVYNLCWNEFYRDETLQDEVPLGNVKVLHRNWNKDYFTSALPWQQRGVAPALPLSGTGSAVWSQDYYLPVNVGSSSESNTDPTRLRSSNPSASENQNVVVGGSSYGGYLASVNLSKSLLDSNSIDMSNVATFDVSDLRLAFQVQKWMERNARSGVRYTEFLHAHYGVSPRDDRLQRPEYLGGSKSPVLISEVVQTSESGTTPQGTLKGKGITADKNFICSYTAKEFGYIIGIFSVMPKPGYFQGVDRKWLRSSRFDFFTPEFGHLSEQAVTTEELYALSGTSNQSGIGNDTIFGYQARFNEMRQNHDVFCGDLRPNGTLGYWNLGRYFDSVPQLNSDFITMNASNDHLKRIFAVQDVKGMVVNFANIITAIRPIPKFGEPGLIDHN